MSPEDTALYIAIKEFREACEAVNVILAEEIALRRALDELYMPKVLAEEKELAARTKLIQIASGRQRYDREESGGFKNSTLRSGLGITDYGCGSGNQTDAQREGSPREHCGLNREA